jgi:hypothetical protein
MARGERLRQARRDAGYRTMRDAAGALGIPYSTFASQENGHRNYGFDEAVTYAGKFKVDVHWLLTGKSSGTNTSPEDEAISKALGKPSEQLPTLTMTHNTPAFEINGRMLVRINQEISWAKAMKIGAILAED